MISGRLPVRPSPFLSALAELWRSALIEEKY